MKLNRHKALIELSLMGMMMILGNCLINTCLFEQEVYTGEAVMSETAQYVVVDTGQNTCYDNTREIPCPRPGSPFYGQDAQYQGPQMAYQNNEDGTISDLKTGLMWQQIPPTDRYTWDNIRQINYYYKPIKGCKQFKGNQTSPSIWER